MATFSKRVTASGEVTYQAKCRRKGLPTQSKTFKSLADAKKWARQIERAFDTGEGLAAPVQSDSTLGDILKRYREEVCPMLRGGDLEAQRINLWFREWPFTGVFPMPYCEKSSTSSHGELRRRVPLTDTLKRSTSACAQFENIDPW